MNTGRPKWSLAIDPAGLARYVPTGVPVQGMPAPGSLTPLGRAGAVFEALSMLSIEYGTEPTASSATGQVIREPAEILGGPQHATCLDLAVLYAGLCLDAELHPVIVILKPDRLHEPGHAVVLVWTRGPWNGDRQVHGDYPYANGPELWTEPPEGLELALRTSADDDGDWVAVDVAVAADGYTADVATSLDEARWAHSLRSGAQLLGGNTGWSWELAVDVGLLTTHVDQLEWAPVRQAAPRRRPTWILTQPYHLMQAPSGFVGRRDELLELGAFVDGKQDHSPAVLLVKALGGMGKSALVWTFLQNELPAVAAEHRPEVIIWWSFSDPQGDVGSLVARLAELGSEGEEPSKDGTLDAALGVLRAKRCLLVLDGLERQLDDYTSMSRRRDLESDRPTTLGQQPTNTTISDPRLAQLFATVVAGARSMVIGTTRLIPAQLEAAPGVPRHGVGVLELAGLSRDESRRIATSYGLPHDQLLLNEIEARAGFHPLLLQIIASGLASQRLDPAQLVATMSREGLPEGVTDQVIATRSALFDHIAEQLTQDELVVAEAVARALAPLTTAEIERITHEVTRANPDTADQPAVNVPAALGKLQDFGFVARDTTWSESRWFTHPIVRGTIEAREQHHQSESIIAAVAQELSPSPTQLPTDARSVEELAGHIQQFKALCDVGRFDDAANFYLRALNGPLMFQCREHQVRLTLIGSLFPDGWSADTPIQRSELRTGIFNALALTYQWLGHNRRAAELLNASIAESEPVPSPTLWSNLASVLMYTDDLPAATTACLQAIHLSFGRTDPTTPLFYLAIIMRQSGRPTAPILEAIDHVPDSRAPRYWTELRRGDLALWEGQPQNALDHGIASLAATERFTPPSYAPQIEARRLIGQALVELGRYEEAVTHLERAFRAVQDFTLLQEELPIRVALARSIMDSDPDRAETIITAGFSDRNPLEYRWIHVDAHTTLFELYTRRHDGRAGRHKRMALDLAAGQPERTYVLGAGRLGADSWNGISLLAQTNLPDQVRTLVHRLTEAV